MWLEDGLQKGKNEDLVILALYTGFPKMDWGFNYPFLSPYDFNSDLEGCYKEGLYENLNGKAYGSKMHYRKKNSWTFDTLYIELDLPDPEILPFENPLSGSM